MFLNEFISLDEGKNDPGIFKAIFMAGPPGAGKNYIIQKLGLEAYGLKLNDIDHVMASLKQRDYKKSYNTWEKRRSLLQQQYLGLLINTTGRDPKRLMQLNSMLRKAGYHTFMLFVDVEKDVALKRIQNRKTSATDPRDANRDVDVDYFNQTYADCRNQIDFYQYMFDEDFALVTNNVLLTETPSEIFNQSLRIADKKIRQFINKPLTNTAKKLISS